nr:MAG TPA: hypothetical protein [Bacteriophage sp.]
MLKISKTKLYYNIKFENKFCCIRLYNKSFSSL